MQCILLQYSDTRRKYVIKHESDSEYFIGYITLEKYLNHWNIELMNILEQRKGYGTQLLNYVINDMKNITQKLTVDPVTDESRCFFNKHNFKMVSGYFSRMI